MVMTLSDVNGARLRFSRAIYAEHLEEAAFLYDQRGVLLHDEGVAWTGLRHLEERLDAHLDGLFTGHQIAEEMCLKAAAEGEPGERHAAVRIFCRQGRLDRVERAMETLDLHDDESVLALRNGLKHEWSTTWRPELPRVFEEKTDASLAVLTKVIGFQRLPFEELLIKFFPVCPHGLRYPLIWSLGRLKARSAQGVLNACLEDMDASQSAAAALALLRIGDPLEALPAVGKPETALLGMPQLFKLMFSGGKEQCGLLIRCLDNGKQTADLAIALGVIGDPLVVPPLLSLVGHSEHGDAAALALNLITGADLFEETFVPEKVDPDELFDDELALNGRDGVNAPPDQFIGETVTRLSNTKETWQTWWQAHRSAFQPGIRYRQGQPYGPVALIDSLKSERSSPFVRRLAAEELVIRYGIHVAFETDMTVRDQTAALDRMSTLCASGTSEFEAGHWYFAGKMLT